MAPFKLGATFALKKSIASIRGKLDKLALGMPVQVLLMISGPKLG
jgi:hypothetical protein